MRLFWLALLLLLVGSACTRWRHRGRVTSPDELCSGYDEDEAKACRGQGRRFYYGPYPDIYCRGVPPGPGDEGPPARSSCTCIDEAELARRQDLCSSVP